MMLPYSFQDETSVNDAFADADMPSNSRTTRTKRTTRDLHLVLDKVQIPQAGDVVDRPRITDFLERSATSFGATLVSGRAITGKTYAALCLAREYRSVAWYTVDPGDAEWDVFANYLWTAVAGSGRRPDLTGETTDEGMAAVLSKLFATAARRIKEDKALIVLDDLHHVFDAPWFPSFFSQILSSVPGNTHLLMLCRSRPALPLWRLRSKQVLNVIDEKMLAFDPEETARLCQILGVSEQLSRKIPTATFGRAGKVADFLRSRLADADADAFDAPKSAVHR